MVHNDLMLEENNGAITLVLLVHVAHFLKLKQEGNFHLDDCCSILDFNHALTFHHIFKKFSTLSAHSN
jgi:hypothetical protein